MVAIIKITTPLSKILFLQCLPVHKTGFNSSFRIQTDITFFEAFP